MNEEDILKEAKEIDEELNHIDHRVKKTKGIMWYILGPLIALMIIMMVVPYYSIKLDPTPSNIPLISEVFDFSGDADNYSSFISLNLVDGVSVKSTADKIASISCESGNKVCHAKAMFYFVRDNFDYVSDPTAFEYVKTARQSLASGGGDCDDASILLASLLDAVGIKSRLVFVPKHVFVQANLPSALNKYKIDGDFVNLDATCASCKFGELSYSVSSAEKHYLG